MSQTSSQKTCACCGYARGPGFGYQRDHVEFIVCAQCNNFGCLDGQEEETVLHSTVHKYRGNNVLVRMATEKEA